MPTSTEVAIATTTLGSAASSITFSSISSAYTDLRLVLVTVNANAPQIEIQFNSDTATNYSNTRLYGFGATAASNRTSNNAGGFGGFGGNASPGLFTYDLFSYAGSTYKTGLYGSFDDNNGSGQVMEGVGLWRSTSAINTIKINSGGTFDTGTTATLYGIL